MSGGTAGATAGPGIEFTETMRGFVSTTAFADYQQGADAGKAAGSILDFTVTVSAVNLERLIADPAHEAVLNGTITVPAIAPAPLTVTNGQFHLLVRDAATPDTRKMVYHMPAVAADGRRFHVEGFKDIHDDAGPDIWKDTTTLFVTVRTGDRQGEVVARGIVKILIADFQKQLRTMKVTGASGMMDELKTMAQFGRFFMGELFDVYGGIFRRGSHSSEKAE
jgi:cholesterol oxidase